MIQTPDALLPVLLHIQANLDADLSLASLSRQAAFSPSYFHRTFRSQTGETPAGYVTRLRLERAAFRLQIHETSILQIALDCGFRNHETFTRSFSRAFGKTPVAYRDWRRRLRAHAPEPASADTLRPSTFELSATKIVRLKQMHLAFIRHVGPYEDVPDSLFDELDEWALRRHMPGPRIWLGIGHDAPSTTSPSRLRFDAALVTPEAFRQRDRVGYQAFAAGEFAVTTHVGAYASLPRAYSEIFRRAVALDNCTLVGLPAVEFYRSVKVNSRHHLTETDICLPVRRRS